MGRGRERGREVATWLFSFLIKAKFYHWLNSMGGWVSEGGREGGR